MTEDDIFKIINILGFQTTPNYPVTATYKGYYDNYCFRKVFLINEPLPFYELYQFDCIFSTNDKVEVCDKLKEIFNKELRKYKINKMLK